MDLAFKRRRYAGGGKEPTMFKFANLDEVTRPFMLQAISDAEASDQIYYSSRFNELGRERWVPLLREAAATWNEHWLAYQLETDALMKDFEQARKREGGYTTKHVPHTAAETLADGQFNRFYMLGLCKRSRTEGVSELEIYRAKERSETRGESDALVGNRIAIDELEEQLRTIKASFSSPLLRPNSGLSVKLPT